MQTPTEPQTALYKLDKTLIRRAFDRAAQHYDGVAVLQHEIGQRMLERLALIRLQPQTVIDIGAGTGHTTRQLSRHYAGARIVALDLSPRMLLQARRHRPSWWRRWKSPFSFVCGDAETLPFIDNSVDMIFSNLTLQWCNDLDHTFSEFRRILRPGGLLLFSTFGPDTLKELRQCWQGLDRFNHVNAFVDMHDIGDALLRATLTDPVMDMEVMTLTYRTLNKLMHELKAIGAHNVSDGRPRGLTGKTRLQRLAQAYEQFRRDDGLLPASYEIIYGHAWAAENIQQRSPSQGEVRIPADQIRGQRMDRSKHR